jgi:hypothetical protein
MSISGFAPGKEITTPRGQWSTTAQKRKGTPARASAMQNARISPGVSGMRPGTIAINPTVSAKVTGIYNWIEPGIQNLVGAPGGNYHNLDGDFEIQIDNPEPSHTFVYTPVGGVLNINFFGWAVAGAVNTVTGVTMVIDGIAPAGTVTIGIPRTDVAAARPGMAGSPNFGWALTVDASGLAAGAHLLQVVATDSAANTIQAYGIFYINSPATSEQNLVMYQEGVSPGAIKRYRQSDGNILTIVADTSTAREPSFAPLDKWLYVAAYDTLGNGVIQTRVTDGNTVDLAFRGPITPTDFTAVDAAAGFCTIGTHLLGFVYQNRTGYAGRPTTTIFSTPMSVTLSSDNRRIDITVTLPPLADGGSGAMLFLIMTRADNPANWYFVPTDLTTGSVGEQPVPFNNAIDLPFTANISDADLAASADSANDQFLLLSQDDLGAGPFNPSFVGNYGLRMLYGNGTILYASDINNPQSIAQDRNQVLMPSQRKFGYAFGMPGGTALILTGDRWTAYVTDNNDIPATWAPPVRVSDALGAPFANCVCYRTGGNYAWITTESGVYLFTGSYAELPLTYLQDEWATVNWKAAYAIQMADDTVAHKLYVGCPFGVGVTEPNAMFVIDYTNGLTYNTVDIGIDVFNPAVFSALGVVKEDSTNQSNLWIGPSAAGSMAHFDATVRADQGHAIESFWECGLARGNEIISNMIRVGYCDVWIRGSGTAICWVYGPGHVISVNPQLQSTAGVPATLTPDPGIMYGLKFDISQIENYTIRVGTNAVGDWWELSMLKPYEKQGLFNR